MPHAVVLQATHIFVCQVLLAYDFLTSVLNSGLGHGQLSCGELWTSACKPGADPLVIVEHRSPAQGVLFFLLVLQHV